MIVKDQKKTSILIDTNIRIFSFITVFLRFDYYDKSQDTYFFYTIYIVYMTQKEVYTCVIFNSY